MTKETERFTLRLTSELKNQLDESRKHMGISLNALLVQILWEWLKEGERDENSRFHKSAEYHWRP